MRQIRSQRGKELLKILAIVLGVLLAMPAGAYDFPLTSSAIRDAYFLGARQGGLTPQFLARYSHRVSDLHERSCISEIRLETPFLQVADYTSKVPNYSSQDAVKDFRDKPLNFRIFLNICYMSEAPPPNTVRIKVVQNKKEIVPLPDTRSAYAEPLNEYGFLPPNGEKAQLEIDAQKVDSSTFTIQIDTPDGQHAECMFDMQALR